ncbi:MAG: nucleoid-associated protein YgaU [Glaciecola sp.]|jgi:nucleoid-associated protein YgaU
MGKIEKVVVLSVLFLMVVITVVSMTGPEDAEPAGEKNAQLDAPNRRLRNTDDGDLGTMRRRTDESRKSDTSAIARKRSAGLQDQRAQRAQRDQRAQPASDRKLSEANPDGLLSVGVRQDSTQRAKDRVKSRLSTNSNPAQATTGGLMKPKLNSVQDPALDPNWDLVRLDGLTSTINPAYKIYKCRKGDTFEAIARHYYGDKRHAHFLRRNNEGVRTLAVNQALVLPCVNEAPLANTYTVLEGDSLWSIAQSQYNAGHRWKEIYDANRHVLRSPDDLKQGLELAIP